MDTKDSYCTCIFCIKVCMVSNKGLKQTCSEVAWELPRASPEGHFLLCRLALEEAASGLDVTLAYLGTSTAGAQSLSREGIPGHEVVIFLQKGPTGQ